MKTVRIQIEDTLWNTVAPILAQKQGGDGNPNPDTELPDEEFAEFLVKDSVIDFLNGVLATDHNKRRPKLAVGDVT